MVLFLDLETTGVDVTQDRVVELSAVQALPVSQGACFSTVVQVDAGIMSMPGARKAAEIHGIPTNEILASPRFPDSWSRFLGFVDVLLNDFVQNQDESSDDEIPSLSRPPDEQPTLLIAAHNGFSFDFAMLLCECYRHGLDITIFNRWVYVDTLHVVKSSACEAAACFKLQCMTERICEHAMLKAHRALDDCMALFLVLQDVSARLGLTVEALLRMFAEEILMNESIAQVRTLVCD